MAEDIISKHARIVLDSLSVNGQLAEWRPDMSGDQTVVVVFPDESAARITVESIPDPGPVDA